MKIETKIEPDFAFIEDAATDFARHLLGKNLIGAELARGNTGTSQSPAKLTLRQLWEASDISAHDFAEEVAAFYRLRRMNLPQLIGANSLTQRFSQRFLREAAMFPFEAGKGRLHLAVGDPLDIEPQKAVEIVLGGPVEILVASFEDIATALVERLGPDEERPAAAAEGQSASADENIDSLRDLASGAPVVRAVNDLLEKAMELRASDIHIEPLRAGLSVRMRVGRHRACPAPGADLAHQDSGRP